jgi:hypothetical protein
VSVTRQESSTAPLHRRKFATSDSGDLDPPGDRRPPPLCGPGCSRAGRELRVVPTFLRAVAAVAADAGGPEPAERRGHLPRWPVIAFGGYCTTAPAAGTGTETQLGAGPLVVPAKALLGGGATCPSSGHGAGGAAAGGGGYAARQAGALHGLSGEFVLPGGQGGGCPQKDGRGVEVRWRGAPGPGRSGGHRVPAGGSFPTTIFHCPPPTILTTDRQRGPVDGQLPHRPCAS